MTLPALGPCPRFARFACFVVTALTHAIILAPTSGQETLPPEVRAEILELPRKYRAAKDDVAREQVLQRALEIGDKAVSRLKPLVVGNVERAAADYGKRFRSSAVNVARNGKVTVEKVLDESDVLAGKREELAALAKLADVISDQSWLKKLDEHEQEMVRVIENARRMSSLDPQEQAVIRHINEARSANGLPPLQVDPRLCAAAKGHSNDMAAHNFFSHNSPVQGRGSFAARARQAGASAAAENIAKTGSGKATVKAWMNSSGHRKNILSKTSRIGVGRNGSLYTALFGR